MTPGEFRFSVRVPVRFSDMDSLGHVNNAAYLSYFEEARVSYFRTLMNLEEEDASALKMIVLEIKCTYKSPAVHGETLDVHTRVSRMKNKSLDMLYLIIDSASGRIVAEGSSVLVGYDYAARKSISIPGEFRKRIAKFEGIPERAE